MTSSEYAATAKAVDQAFDLLDNAGPDIDKHMTAVLHLLLFRVTGRYAEQGLIDDMVDARAGMYAADMADNNADYRFYENRLHDAMRSMILGTVGVSA